jgi:putative acetyltransferase
MEQTSDRFLIRKASVEDISRIAEILVFVKRMNYRAIFRNDAVSFGEIQVIPVAEQYSKPEILDSIWVYEAEGIVKGLIRIVGKEVVELYVEHFFQGQGIGAKLIEFAKKEQDAKILWVLEKNTDAIRFYETHGFHLTENRIFDEGTTEYKVLMEL